MPMVWQDWTSLNKKYNDAWLAGLGDAGVFDGGNVLVPRKSGAAGLGALTFAQVQTLQDLLNIENDYRNRPLIQVTGQWNDETCLTVYYYTQLLIGGEQVDPFLYDFLYNNELDISAACQALSQGAATQPAAAPPPTTPTTTSTTTTTTSQPPPGGGGATVPVSPCTAEGCDCLVYEGDAGPHIENLQAQINAALDAAGYVGIPMTGVYDKATCGAIFELRGSFDPDFPPMCTNVEGEWVIPLQCADMVLPKKKSEAGGTSKASMFAVGGLLLAAGVGAAYWVSKR